MGRSGLGRSYGAPRMLVLGLGFLGLRCMYERPAGLLNQSELHMFKRGGASAFWWRLGNFPLVFSHNRAQMWAAEAIDRLITASFAV